MTAKKKKSQEGQRRFGPKPRDYDAEWIRTRYWNEEDPWGIEQIAGHYGVSPASILRVMDKYEIPRRRRGAFGSKHRSAKLTEDSVKQIRELLRLGGTMQEIADIYGVTRQAIHLLKSGQTWQSV